MASGKHLGTSLSGSCPSLIAGSGIIFEEEKDPEILPAIPTDAQQVEVEMADDKQPR